MTSLSSVNSVAAPLIWHGLRATVRSSNWCSRTWVGLRLACACMTRHW
jgi:hypothetical protein